LTARDHLQRVVRQHLITSKLMGVDFVPISGRVAASGSAVFDQTTSAHRAAEPLPSSSSRASDKSADGEARRASESIVNPGVTISATSAPSAGEVQARVRALEELRERHDQSCPHCTTVTYHTRTVFGEGSPVAPVMFIGEAPGEDEDRTGRPFVGKAGQKLTEIIKAMGFAREDVYIANVLKARPPQNRTPLEHEMEACGTFVLDQIRIIRPRAIVTLGNPATQYLLRTKTGITRMRGLWAEFDAGGFVVPVMPTFHPSYVLRNYTVETRQKVWSDMQAVLQKLREG
jgi:uracil-DNA glycosylase